MEQSGCTCLECLLYWYCLHCLPGIGSNSAGNIRLPETEQTGLIGLQSKWLPPSAKQKGACPVLIRCSTKQHCSIPSYRIYFSILHEKHQIGEDASRPSPFFIWEKITQRKAAPATSDEREDEEGKDNYLCNGWLPMKEVDGKSKLS